MTPTPPSGPPPGESPLRRFTRSCAQTLWTGFLYLGVFHYAPLGLALWPAEDTATPVPRDLPHGHPERLLPKVELTQEERELWERIWAAP